MKNKVSCKLNCIYYHQLYKLGKWILEKNLKNML